MTESEMQLIRSSTDKELIVEFTDGEVAHIKLVLIGEEEEDIIFDFVPQKDHAVRALWTEVRSVKPWLR